MRTYDYKAVVVVAIPNLRHGGALPAQARIRIDVKALARDLAWKAYYNKGKEARAKNGAIVVDFRISK